MQPRHRRAFLAEVGQGMLVATVGYGTAVDLGLARAFAAELPSRLSFGSREALVSLMQETPSERLMPMFVEQLRRGTTLRELVAAAALANARSFGGDDYIGFHAFMAMAPALTMAERMPERESALPVLKVLYRSCHRIQEHGGSAAEVLKPVEQMQPAGDSPLAEQIRQAIHAHDLARAEQLLATAAAKSPEAAYNDLLPVVAEGVDVHRTVLAYRAWDLLDLVGQEHAVTFLRQSLHYCADTCENVKYNERFAGIQKLLPKLLDQYRLVEMSPGTRRADDAWLGSMAETLYFADADRAADAVAAALADGMSAESVADAIALAANHMVLRDPGRTQRQASASKPAGSVHGDSLGVHACDSVNAWRNIAEVANRKNALACLILSAWQVASDRGFGGSEIVASPARPYEEHLEQVKSRDPRQLLHELDDAIRQKDQGRACAATHLYGEQNGDPQPVLDLLLRYAVSEDGALHAEKFYNTATEEFARTRAPYRWRQLVALSRVTASEYGQPAPRLDEARKLLDV
ncbi:MAG: hypothetical protein KF708_13125 [Pirellulales bacterium]|nr:hypothetical protein [Pirellulales bacterium]